MIRLIAIAAFALAVATSAQAMSPPPLHQSDGIGSKPTTVATVTAAALPVATAGIGITATAGIGATATAGIAATATAGTATTGIGPAMESSAAKSAGARCGAQGTFAVGGIETP